MPDLAQWLRDELRRAVAGQPAEPAAAYRHAVRRVARRQAAARAVAGVGFVAILATAVVLPAALRAPDGATDDPGRAVTTPPRPPSTTLPTRPNSAPDRAARESPAGCELPPSALADSLRGPGARTALLRAFCSRPAWTATPTTATPGAAVAVAGTCERVDPVQPVDVILMRYGITGSQGPLPATEGAFEATVRLPRALLPGKYWLLVNCGRDDDGPINLYTQGHRLITVTAAGGGAPAGEPDPEGLAVTLTNGPDGKRRLAVTAGGCFLPGAGVAGTLRVAYAAPGAAVPDDVHAFGWFSAERDTWPDGARTYVDDDPGSVDGPYDVHAFCVDSLSGVGFAYETVHRVDGDRIRRLGP